MEITYAAPCDLSEVVDLWSREGGPTSRARADVLGAGKIDATVALENESAIAFWERRGFVHDARDGRWSLRID